MNLFLPLSDNGPGVANRWPVLALGAGSRIRGDISYFASEFASGRGIFQVKPGVFRNRCPAPRIKNPRRCKLLAETEGAWRGPILLRVTAFSANRQVKVKQPDQQEFGIFGPGAQNRTTRLKPSLQKGYR
jgi:hypothetical protein